MFEEDRAPVTLSEIYHQAASCQQSVEFARRRSQVFDQSLPLASYAVDASQFAIRNSQIESFRPALYAHIGHLLAYWRAAARDLNPDAPRHLARTVLLKV